MSEIRTITIYKGKVTDLYDSFDENDFESPVCVVLRDGNIPIDLSRYTNLKLKVVFACGFVEIKDELDLDHPYLPRTYKSLSLSVCRLVGSFLKPIEVKFILKIGWLIADERFRSYATCDIVYAENCTHTYCNAGYFIPPGIQWLSLKDALPVSLFEDYLQWYPKLKAVSVALENEQDADMLWNIVKREVHRLSPNITCYITLRADYYDELNVLSNIQQDLIQKIKQMFYRLEMAKIFFMLNERHRGLGLPFAAIIRFGFISQM